ncbi:cysteine-rich venom protein-like [Vombatus ursinus]|uniref:cysteine-rich venom protein-like n=1 Tax=Vombatus ursinus TaxID=29139 RepID=UPI000FFDBB9C|nr:cysteine-rich venom protein-like [Vombatus ursinus]
MNNTSTNQIIGPSAPKIVNKYNELRRMTNPTARNILKMLNVSELQQVREHVIDFPDVLANCGENIYTSTGIKSWSDVIQEFYDEVKDFLYGYRPTKKAVIGHYTQLVWATSHQFGCALSHCLHKKFQYFYVCHYCPV